MTIATMTMAVLMGFAGSLHCAGMCGPIVWIMPFQAFTGAKRVAAITLYHLARISVYAAMAMVLFSFRGFFNPRIQQYLSLGMGIALLVIGALSFFAHNLGHFRLPWEEQIKRRLGGVIGKPGLGAITAAGFLNGLLPCGLVYMALSAAITLPTPPQAAAMIYLFGLGTFPMLAGITILRQKAHFLRTPQLKRLVPLTVFVFGFLFVLRGANLGIPYLSPKVSMKGGAVKAACCHKN